TIETVRANNASLEDDQKISFLSKNKMKIYEDLIRLLVNGHRRDPAQGYDKEAFHYAERARARALLDLLAEARVDLHKKINLALRNAAEIYPEPVTWDQAQKLLDEKTALLEYVLGPDRSYLFVVTQEHFGCYPLAPRDVIERQVKPFTDLIAQWPTT